MKRELLKKIYCERCGPVEYYIEKPHHDLNGKMFADLVCTKCALVIATFSE